MANFEAIFLNCLQIMRFLTSWKFLYIITLAAILAVFTTISMLDLGIGMVFSWQKKTRKKTEIFRQKSQFCSQFWEAHKIFLIIFSIIFFCNFQNSFEILNFVLNPLILGLIFTLILREILQFLRKKIQNEKFHILTDFFITESCLLTTLIFGAILGEIFIGLPFYIGKKSVIFSFFELNDLANIKILTISAILAISALSIGATYINFRTKSMKIFSILVNFALLTIFVIAIPPLFSTNCEWIHSFFKPSLIYIIPGILQISAILAIFFNRTRLALIIEIFSILTLNLIFFSAIFPYILPSCIETMQSTSIFNSQNIIKNPLIWLALLSSVIFFAIEFCNKIFSMKNFSIRPIFSNILLTIFAILLMFLTIHNIFINFTLFF